jgi:hypothetical protein
MIFMPRRGAVSADCRFALKQERAEDRVALSRLIEQRWNQSTRGPLLVVLHHGA